jgi:O-antigen/teichoic acid export membrane protein
MNRTPLRTTRFNLASQYLSLGLNVAGGLLLTPLALRSLDPALYGVWLLTGDVLAWLSLTDPGVSTVLAQRVAVLYGEKNKAEIGRSLVAGLLLTGLVVVLLIGLGLAALPWLGEIVRLDGAGLRPVRQAFVVALTGTGLVVFSHTLFAVTQGLQSGPGNGLIYNGALLLSLVATAFGLARGWGLPALAWPVVLRGGLYALGNGLYLGWRLRAEGIRLRFPPKNLRELLQPLPLTLLARVAGALLANFENALLARRLGLAAVPVYALTRKGPDLARLFLERGVVAVSPALALAVGQGDDGAVHRVLARVGLVLIWALGALAGGVLLFNEAFVRLWVGEAFFGGKPANALLAAVVVLQALGSVLVSLGVALGQVRRTSRLQIGLGLLHAASVGAGVWLGGMVGLLLGAALSFAVGVVGLARLVARTGGLLPKTKALFYGEILRQTALTGTLVAAFSLLLPELRQWTALLGYAGLFAGLHLFLTLGLSPAGRVLLAFRRKTKPVLPHP